MSSQIYYITISGIIWIPEISSSWNQAEWLVKKQWSLHWKTGFDDIFSVRLQSISVQTCWHVKVESSFTKALVNFSHHLSLICAGVLHHATSSLWFLCFDSGCHTKILELSSLKLREEMKQKTVALNKTLLITARCSGSGGRVVGWCGRQGGHQLPQIRSWLKTWQVAVLSIPHVNHPKLKLVYRQQWIKLMILKTFYHAEKARQLLYAN